MFLGLLQLISLRFKPLPLIIVPERLPIALEFLFIQVYFSRLILVQILIRLELVHQEYLLFQDFQVALQSKERSLTLSDLLRHFVHQFKADQLTQCP